MIRVDPREWPLWISPRPMKPRELVSSTVRDWMEAREASGSTQLIEAADEPI
jgi:hypothetical protein